MAPPTKVAMRMNTSVNENMILQTIIGTVSIMQISLHSYMMSKDKEDIMKIGLVKPIIGTLVRRVIGSKEG